jgi:hypothetical protein
MIFFFTLLNYIKCKHKPYSLVKNKVVIQYKNIVVLNGTLLTLSLSIMQILSWAIQLDPVKLKTC